MRREITRRGARAAGLPRGAGLLRMPQELVAVASVALGGRRCEAGSPVVLADALRKSLVWSGAFLREVMGV